mgnify:CR=1 FL=1
MRRGAAVVTAGLLLALVGCAPAPAFPDGVSVLVYQPRPDVAAGRLAIQVANDGPTAIEVTAARLVSPGFAADVVWPGESSTLTPGRRVDLRAPVPEFDCAAEADTVAELELASPDGSVRGTLPIDDPYDLLARMRAEQCIGVALAAIATVTPREVIVPAGREPAVLVLDVAPTGAAGSIVIAGVRSTTLLQPAADGAPVAEIPLGIELAADGPRELRVPLLPNRCDAHALAEDKVGTIIPFLVDTGSAEPTRWMLVLPDGLKGALYGYYADYCGL